MQMESYIIMAQEQADCRIVTIPCYKLC